MNLLWQQKLCNLQHIKFAVFTYRSPHGDASAIITQCVAWMENQFNACKTPPSMYLSILNNFRVIRFLSQCVIFLPHFCFPWGRPWGNHGKCCMDGKTFGCLRIVLQHVPIYVQQFPSYSSRKCQKSPFSRTAAHIFVSPGDTPAIITEHVAWLERQFNACQTPRSMYLSVFRKIRHFIIPPCIRRPR